MIVVENIVYGLFNKVVFEVEIVVVVKVVNVYDFIVLFFEVKN